MRFLFLLLGGALTWSCATRPPAPQSSTPQAPSSPRDVSLASTPSVRTVPKEATFADLISIAQKVEDQGQSDSHRGCVLEKTEQGWELEGDLAPALTQLPEAPLQLEHAWKEQVGFQILTRWGPLGTQVGGVPLAAVTNAPLTARKHILLLVAHQSVHLWSLADDASHTTVPIETFVKNALPHIDAVDAAVWITANADISMTELYRIFAALGPTPIGLVVALPENTRLPTATPTVTRNEIDFCPDGLPETNEPFGELAPSDILSALSNAHQQAQECANISEKRVKLWVRIDTTGFVKKACADSIEQGTATAAQCLLAMVRRIQFPRPSPAGVVDVAVPLHLSPVEIQRERGACE